MNQIVFIFVLLAKRKTLIRGIELVSGGVTHRQSECWPPIEWLKSTLKQSSISPTVDELMKIVGNFPTTNRDSVYLSFPFGTTCTHEKWLFIFFFYFAVEFSIFLRHCRVSADKFTCLLISCLFSIFSLSFFQHPTTSKVYCSARMCCIDWSTTRVRWPTSTMPSKVVHHLTRWVFAFHSPES